MSVYMIKFDQPLGDPEKRWASARYYVGWVKGNTYAAAVRRLRPHQNGKGASITRAAAARGIVMQLVLFIADASHKVEERIKKAGHYERFLNSYNAGRTKMHLPLLQSV